MRWAPDKGAPTIWIEKQAHRENHGAAKKRWPEKHIQGICSIGGTKFELNWRKRYHVLDFKSSIVYWILFLYLLCDCKFLLLFVTKTLLNWSKIMLKSIWKFNFLYPAVHRIIVATLKELDMIFLLLYLPVGLRKTTHYVTH